MKTLLLRFCVFSLVIFPALQAQRVNPPPAAATPAESEQPVQLSPFEVSSGAVQGYATTSATSASRIAVPITDLSTSVIVINEKLIEDLVAVTPEETLNLIGGVTAFGETQSQESNKFSARGYTSVGAQRDGFTDLLFGANGGFNYAFVERMEFVKGPNGILYGEHTPGGMLNLVSKRPLAKPRTKIGVMAGSYGFYRADLDTSNLLGAKQQFGYRLSASYSLVEGPNDTAADVFRDKGFFALNPVVRYRTDNGVELWAWTGFVRDKSPRLRRITKTFEFSGDDVAHPIMAIADDGGAHNVLTNMAQVTTDNYELGATKSFEFGAVRMDARVLGRYIEQFDSNSLVNATGGEDAFVDRAGNVIGIGTRAVDFSRVESDLGGFYRTAVQATGRSDTTESSTYAADLGFSFKLGPTQHKLLVFGTRNELDRSSEPGIGGRTYQVTNADVLTRLGAERVGNIARVWLYPISRNVFAGIDPQVIVANANSSSAQNTSVIHSEQYAAGAVERVSAWNNRAIVVGGARFTSNDTTNRVGTAAPTATTDESWSTSIGGVAKPYKGPKGELVLFYNANETFVPVFNIDQRLASFGQKFPNRTISISEFGAKFDLLQSRLVATLSLYDMKEDNVLISDVDEDGTVTGVVGRGFQTPVGERRTEGWEIDLSYNVRRGFDTIFSYGHRRAKLADGTIPFGQPDNTLSALARYQVQTGRLKGASLTWNYTWWAESILNTRTNWKVPPGELHTAVLGYNWRKFAFRLRVENVFDDLELRPSANETAVGVTSHRNYRFSVSRTW